LVRARASGVGLEDALSQTSGSVPPYRFRYLIEQAKGFTAGLVGFGAALLSALEKRDGEELANLRNTHDANLLKMNAQIRALDVKIAEQGVDQAARRYDASQYRMDYFAGLISAGKSTAETTQIAFHTTAGVLRGVDALLRLASGIMYFIPEIGSPF